MSSNSKVSPANAHLHLAASIGRSTLFGVIANVTQVVTRAVTVPAVIYYLGLGGYGIWNIIMTTATYMRFGAVGVKTAFQKYVAEATGDGDYDRANKLLSTGCAMMLVLSVGALVPAAIFSHRIASLVGVPPQFLEAAAGSVSLLAIIMMLSNVGAAFEAIVMGGHRIDLVRKFGTVLTVCEAVAIIVALHLGGGLLAMAMTMGASEVFYVTACYWASRRVVPQIQLSLAYVSKDVVFELFRFAGSYQLVNLLEVLYVSLLPFAILKVFGANASGVYAVVSRVVTSATVLQDSFLSPILSGGAMIYSSGSAERMRALLVKAFKVTLALSLFPLGFIALFGSTIVYAWTAQVDPLFPVAFGLAALRAGFSSLSMLSLVLYRVSGKGLWDNLRQVLRILIILTIVAFARQLGFYGVLGGLAASECAGMLFMVFALIRTFHLFRAKALLPDMVRLSAAAILMLGAGALVSQVPLPIELNGRLGATVKLVEILGGCALVAWPVLAQTGAVTAAEGTALLHAFFPGRARVAAMGAKS